MSVLSSSALSDKEDDRAKLADAVLAAHFSAATQGVRLEGLEEKAAKADAQMTEVRVELAEAEAQEAVQCVKWRQMYLAEVAEARAFREKADNAEVRMQSSALLKAQANEQNLQELESLRTEVVERGAVYATEREALLREIYDLQAKLAERDGKAAGYEMQVHAAAEAAAQATVERCNQKEQLAQARAEAGCANSRLEAADAARLLAEERRLRAASSIQSLESEVHATTKLEANAIKELRGEAQAEAREAKQAKMNLAELQQASRRDSEAIESLRSLEIERQRDTKAANQMQAGTRQALEELLYYVEHREKGNIKDGSLPAGEAAAFSSISDTDALHKIQEHLRVHNRAAAKSEAVAAAEVEAEALAALAAKKMNEALKEELASQSRAQRDLHNELQALSSAAAAVRAVAKAKDQTITELQAAHRKMASDIAMQKVSGERLSVGSPSKGVHKVGDKIDSRDLGASRYPESASNLSRPRPEKTSSELAFDTMSLDSAATQPMKNSIAASVAKGQDSMSDCSRATVPTWDQLPSRSLPAGSPASKNDMTSPPKELSEEAVATALQGSPGEAESSLYQASAFLNAAAARAAAAASAVEAFIPLMQQPAANAAATAMEDGASNDAPIRTLSSQTPLASMVGASPAASPVNQASVSAILNLNSAVAPAASPGTPPDSVTGASHPPSDVSQSASQPSWEEAQAAMTDQIRKDIALLRKAISDSGMTGTALEDEVQSLLNSTFGQAALQDPSLRKSSSMKPSLDSIKLGGSAFAPRAGSPTQSRGPLLAAKETSALMPPGGRGHLGKFANPATSLEPSRQISKAMQQLQEHGGCKGCAECLD